MKNVVLLFVLTFAFFTASAQDTLVLISGKIIVVKSVEVSDDIIAYRKMEEGSKLKKIDPSKVFSVVSHDGNERIIYKPDSLDPLDFKPEEMRSFILGVQDAKLYYKNNVIKGVSFAFGAGAAYYAFYGLIVPPAVSMFIGSFTPPVDKILTFKIDGNAADALGITKGKHINQITGTVNNPVIKKNDKLVIAHTSLKFEKETPIDSAVSLINSKFKCHRVNAVNSNGKVMLYRSAFPAYNNDNAYLEGFGKKVRDYKIRNTLLCGFVGFIVSSIALTIILNDDDNDNP